MTRTWTLTYEARPHNTNSERQGNRHKRAAWVAEWRAAFRLLALEHHIPPLDAITATVRPVYPNRRSLPDVAACAPSAKAAIDGIVDAGVLPDDAAAYLHAVTFLPAHVEAGRLPALEVTIGEVPA